MRKFFCLLLCGFVLMGFARTTTVLAAVSNPANKPVLLPVGNDPTVSFRLWFKVGSQNDPAGKEGIAALTAAIVLFLFCAGRMTVSSFQPFLYFRF